MTFSWRAAVLVLIGVIPVAIWPSNGLAWGWVALCIVACVADASLAVSPRSLRITRQVPETGRGGQPAVSTVTVSSQHARGLRVDVRDAWPPSMRQDVQVHDREKYRMDH